MKNIQGIQLIMESNEELLPDFFMDFPYICSCVEFDKYIDSGRALALASCSRIILYKKWQSRVYNAKWEMDIPGGDRRVC